MLALSFIKLITAANKEDETNSNEASHLDDMMSIWESYDYPIMEVKAYEYNSFVFNIPQSGIKKCVASYLLDITSPNDNSGKMQIALDVKLSRFTSYVADTEEHLLDKDLKGIDKLSYKDQVVQKIIKHKQYNRALRSYINEFFDNNGDSVGVEEFKDFIHDMSYKMYLYTVFGYEYLMYNQHYIFQVYKTLSGEYIKTPLLKVYSEGGKHYYTIVLGENRSNQQTIAPVDISVFVDMYRNENGEVIGFHENKIPKNEQEFVTLDLKTDEVYSMLKVIYLNINNDMSDNGHLIIDDIENIISQTNGSQTIDLDILLNTGENTTINSNDDVFKNVVDYLKTRCSDTNGSQTIQLDNEINCLIEYVNEQERSRDEFKNYLLKTFNLNEFIKFYGNSTVIEYEKKQLCYAVYKKHDGTIVKTPMLSISTDSLGQKVFDAFNIEDVKESKKIETSIVQNINLYSKKHVSDNVLNIKPIKNKKVLKNKNLYYKGNAILHRNAKIIGKKIHINNIQKPIVIKRSLQRYKIANEKSKKAKASLENLRNTKENMITKHTRDSILSKYNIDSQITKKHSEIKMGSNFNTSISSSENCLEKTKDLLKTIKSEDDNLNAESKYHFQMNYVSPYLGLIIIMISVISVISTISLLYILKTKRELINEYY